MLRDELKKEGYDREEEYFKELERKQLAEFKKKMTQKEAEKEKKAD